MQVLNFAHLEFPPSSNKWWWELGTVLGSERSKGIRVGFSLRTASPPLNKSCVSQKVEGGGDR